MVCYKKNNGQALLGILKRLAPSYGSLAKIGEQDEAQDARRSETEMVCGYSCEHRATPQSARADGFAGLAYLLGWHLLVFATLAHAAPSCQDSLQQGELNVAIQSARLVLQTTANQVDTLLCLGRALRLNGETSEALMVFRQVEQVAQDNDDKAIALVYAGHLGKEAGEYAVASERYQSAHRYATLSGNVSIQRTTEIFIGDVAWAQGKLDSALAHYLAASKRDANDNERAQSAEKIAEVFFQQQAIDKAVEYQVEAYLMQRQSGDVEDVLRTGIRLGRYQFAAHRYDDAENILGKMRALAHSQNANAYEVQALITLIKIKQAQGQTDAVEPLFKAALALATTAKNHEWLKEVSELRDGAPQH